MSQVTNGVRGVTRRALAGCALALIGSAVLAAPAVAQELFPGKQMTLIVPYPAGGTLDQAARLLAEGLRQKFGQNVVVMNRPGGGGTIGLTEMLRAEPDGLTLSISADGQLGTPPAVDPNFKWDPRKDYTPVAQIGEYFHTFMVNSAVPAKTMQEFIAYAKANPGKLNYGSPGIGTLNHIAMLLIMSRTGMDMVHVPYKGGANMMTDLMSGVVQVNIQSAPTARAQITSDRVRVLAVFSGQRLEMLPNVPTMVELGFTDLVFPTWLGVFGPAGMSAEIRDKVGRAMVEVSKLPDYQAKFKGSGMEATGKDSQTFAKYYYGEVDRWKAVATQHKVRIGN